MRTLYIERSTGECRSGAWTEELDLVPPPDRIVVGMGPGSFAGIRSALAFAQGYAIGSGCEVFGLPSPCAVVGALGDRALPGDESGALGDRALPRDESGALGDRALPGDESGALGDRALPGDESGALGDRALPGDEFGALGDRALPLVGADHRAARDSRDGAPGEVTVVGDARQGKIWLAEFDGWTMKGAVRQVNAEDLFVSVSPTATVVTPDEVRIGPRLAELFGVRYRGAALPTQEGLRAYAEHVPGALVREPLPIYLNPAVRS